MYRLPFAKGDREGFNRETSPCHPLLKAMTLTYVISQRQVLKSRIFINLQRINCWSVTNYINHLYYNQIGKKYLGYYSHIANSSSQEIID
jgi:hypothetical protein